MVESLPFSRRLNAFALMSAIALLTLYQMDTLTVPPTDESTDAFYETTPPPPTGRAYHAGNRRAYVLLIDSLRFDIATNPDVMPNLSRFREQATWSTMTSTYDALTRPAVRAALTGRETRAVFSFVKNLARTGGAIRSLLTQARLAGIRVAALDQGAFKQFGEDVGFRLFTGDDDEPTHEPSAALHLLEGYFGAGWDLVLAHVDFTDHVAHAHRVGTDEYRRQFGIADQLVGTLARAVGPRDTLIILGDHGHDETGRHFGGLQLRTLLAARGPGFQRGHDLGGVNITDLRYLLGWALGLPLAPDYRGGCHPGALVSEGTRAPGYDRPCEAASGTDIPSWKAGLTRYGLLALHAGLLLAVFLSLLRGPPRAVDWLWTMLAWGSAATLLLDSWMPWPGLAGAALAAGALAGTRHGKSPRAGWLAAAPASGAVLLCLWALGLSSQHSWLRDRLLELTAHGPWLWLGLLPIGLAITHRFGSTAAAAASFLVPLFLFRPTVYAYGCFAALGPAWAAWAIYLAYERRREPRTLLVPAALLLILLPFTSLIAVNYEFITWSGPFAGEDSALWKPLALICKAVVFLRFGMPRVAAALAVVAAGALTALQWGVLELDSGAVLAISGSLMFLAVGLKRVEADPALLDHLQRTAWLAALCVPLYAFVRADPEMHLWTDVLMAAFVLTGSALRTREEPDHLAGVLLGVMALVAAGWVTMTWSLSRFEWAFIYDFVEPSAVEHSAIWVAPFIVARYALPVALFRLLLREARPPGVPFPYRAVLSIWAAKGVAIALFAVGTAWNNPLSDGYMEAAQQVAIFVVISLGLLW